MPHDFSIIDSSATQLWDYGWFDVTRLAMLTDLVDTLTDENIILRLIGSPMYQRSFCETPDPWGAPVDRHGPLLTKTLSAAWYRRIDAGKLSHQVLSAIRDADFDSDPTDDQMSAVYGWISGAQTREDTVFQLTPPDDDGIRVEWFRIWSVFAEFVCINRQAGELNISVIGFD